MTKTITLIVTAFALPFMSNINAVEEETATKIQPIVVPQLVDKAKKNTHWKTAFITGKHEQIVFMNVSPLTNPDNEIGMEEHPFDQVILIVEGRGKAILDEKTTNVKEGDMIFIPQGTPHNVINLGEKKSLKLISFYSENDMPAGTIYKKKADAPAD